jgi:hypothetical protein
MDAIAKRHCVIAILGIREKTKFYNGGDSGPDDCDN